MKVNTRPRGGCAVRYEEKRPVARGSFRWRVTVFSLGMMDVFCASLVSCWRPKDRDDPTGRDTERGVPGWSSARKPRPTDPLREVRRDNFPIRDASAGFEGRYSRESLRDGGVAQTGCKRVLSPEEEFVREFCKRLRRGDVAFVRKHVRLPLRTRVIIDENVGNPIYRRRNLRTIRAVLKFDICAGITGLDPRFADDPCNPEMKVRSTAWGFVLESTVGQFDVELWFEKRKGRYRLTRRWSK